MDKITNFILFINMIAQISSNHNHILENFNIVVREGSYFLVLSPIKRNKKDMFLGKGGKCPLNALKLSTNSSETEVWPRGCFSKSKAQFSPG